MEGKIRLAVFGQKRLSREGGIEIVVKELCTRMAQNGCEVTCYNRAGHHVSGAEYDKTIEYHCSAWFFYLLGSVLLATAVLSFLMQQSQGVEALQMLIGGFVIFMVPQVVGSMVILLELAAVMLRQVWYI